MKEEGFETLKSLVILTVFLGCAFTVAAMVPGDDVISNDESPLEVAKIRTSGPALLVVDTPSEWELKITVTNNLECQEIEDEVEPEDNLVFYATRSGEEMRGEVPQMIGPNTITDVVVKDVLPSGFFLVEYTPSHGIVNFETGTAGETHITWNVGNLYAEGFATLVLTVGVDGFSLPGNYIINSGATASGMVHSTQEVVTDGPTKSILVSVNDGIPLEPPVAEAGIIQMAFEGNPVYLDGSGSIDTDGNIVTYSWYLGEERIADTMTILTHLPVGEHEVELEVADNHGLKDTDTVKIIIYTADAEVPGGVMTGIVRDATTRRGFDPYIVVSNDDFTISTWTDMGGNYRIIGIPAGQYDVTCTQDGYRDTHGEIVITEDSEMTYNIDMFRTNR